MSKVWPVVAGTGHRPQNLSPTAKDWIRAQLAITARWLRAERGTEVGISGMAVGFDLWWAGAILDADLKLWAHVPFPQQPDRWPAQDQSEWRRLLDLADRTTLCGNNYSVGLLHARNDGMLRSADALVACWAANWRRGGTYNALGKAHRRGMPGRWLDPKARTVANVLPDPDAGWVLTCGGRAVDDDLRPVGAVCGQVYRERPDRLISGARAAGWSVVDLPGGVIATCPACRRPDPRTVAACRDLEVISRGGVVPAVVETPPLF